MLQSYSDCLRNLYLQIATCRTANNILNPDANRLAVIYRPQSLISGDRTTKVIDWKSGPRHAYEESQKVFWPSGTVQVRNL